MEYNQQFHGIRWSVKIVNQIHLVSFKKKMNREESPETTSKEKEIDK